MKRPDLELPEARLELVEDLSPPDTGGFLRLVRRRWRAVTPHGSVSEAFVYDEVDRRALDAVVLAAHYVARGARAVYLRSAIRPPVVARDPSRSGDVEPVRGALWELPAGLIEPEELGEQGRLRTAQRELEEELGFHVELGRLLALGPSTLPTPGVIAERHFFFEVEVDPKDRAEPSLDGSALEKLGVVREVTLADALDMCRTGAIEDAKTELGLRRLAERHGS